MGEDILDTDFLFSNFDSPNESEGEVSTKIKKLRKKKLLQPDYLTESKTPEEPITNNSNSQTKYINELEEQNAKLKAILKRMMGPQIFSLNDENNINEDESENEINLLEKLSNDIQKKPFAVVLYLNNDVSAVHRKEIDEAMRNVSFKQSTQDVLMAQKLQPQTSAVPIKAFTANSKGRRSNLAKIKNSHEQYVICACQYYKSFFIDRMGAPLLEDNPGVTDIWDVPSYPQVFLKALPIVEESLNIRVRQMKQCFNCGGEHHLESCTEPRDNERIRRNRMEHSASKVNSPSNFHNQMSDEVDERFKHFKAGELSVGLEEALGISLSSQLPPYIYKMRALGYPPGWIKPLDDGGLKLYDADGYAQEIGCEEGEIKPIKLPDIIKYPGFNAPLPEGVRDESEEIGLPPFRPDLVELDVERKRGMILGYDADEPVAKKLNFGGDDNNEADMEIEDDTSEREDGKPPLPLIETAEDLRKPPPPPEESKMKKKKKEKSKEKKDKIDETTYRNWYNHKPLSSIGITYVIFTPPPVCRGEVNLLDLPKNPITDIDREPWKTANASWYDPLYGDLSVPIGTYDNIRTLLKENKTPRRKKKL